VDAPVILHAGQSVGQEVHRHRHPAEGLAFPWLMFHVSRIRSTKAKVNLGIESSAQNAGAGSKIRNSCGPQKSAAEVLIPNVIDLSIYQGSRPKTCIVFGNVMILFTTVKLGSKVLL